MKKLIYNSNLKKDIENYNKELNIYEEIFKYLVCLLGICFLAIIINVNFLLPAMICYITVSIPIFKSYIKNKIKRINNKKKNSSNKIDKLISELYDNSINISKKELICSKTISTKTKKISRNNNEIIKNEASINTDYYLKDIQNRLKILRREKKTTLENYKIINECSLYLMEENELDYEVPQEYKRILK